MEEIGSTGAARVDSDVVAVCNYCPSEYTKWQMVLVGGEFWLSLCDGVVAWRNALKCCIVDALQPFAVAYFIHCLMLNKHPIICSTVRLAVWEFPLPVMAL